MMMGQTNSSVANGEQARNMQLVSFQPGVQQNPTSSSTPTTRADPEHSPSTTDDNPPGTFYPFTRLPAEIRAMIIRHAIQSPGITYFQLSPKHLLPNSRPLHPHVRSTCNSTWRQHLALARTSPEFAHVVNLALTQSKNKRCIDARKKRPFNKHDDLVAFSLSLSIGRDWMPQHVNAPPDDIYTRFGHGLKRVGIKYEPEKHFCVRKHYREGPWSMRFSADIASRCYGACRASMCRYVSFFRDADVVYLMVYLTDRSISRRIKHRRGGPGALSRATSTLQTMQKGTCLEKWKDSAFTWVEADRHVAHTLLTPAALTAWDVADYLTQFVQATPDSHRSLVNMKMQFKVLVSTHHMRWNPRSLHLT